MSTVHGTNNPRHPTYGEEISLGFRHLSRTGGKLYYLPLHLHEEVGHSPTAPASTCFTYAMMVAMVVVHGSTSVKP